MAARATRSTSWAVRLGALPHACLLQLAADALTELPEDHAEALVADRERCLLLALSHDALGVIFDGLADPLQPVVAVAFSSTCVGLRTPLRAALEVLKERHTRAVALCRKMHTCPFFEDRYVSCAELPGAEKLYTSFTAKLYKIGRLVADDMATLGMILRTNGLPKLQEIWLDRNDADGFGDAGVQALCDDLGRGAAPSLRLLNLVGSKFGPAGAEALAAALGRGAMPKVEKLCLNLNPIGNQGVAALAPVLRKMPALKTMTLVHCGIGDEGVASLVDNLGKDDFKALEQLRLKNNKITDAGVAKLLAALDTGGLPKLVDDYYMLPDNPASAVAVQALKHALVKRLPSRRSFGYG